MLNLALLLCVPRKKIRMIRDDVNHLQLVGEMVYY